MEKTQNQLHPLNNNTKLNLRKVHNPEFLNSLFYKLHPEAQEAVAKLVEHIKTCQKCREFLAGFLFESVSSELNIVFSPGMLNHLITAAELLGVPKEAKQVRGVDMLTTEQKEVR